MADPVSTDVRHKVDALGGAIDKLRKDGPPTVFVAFVREWDYDDNDYDLTVERLGGIFADEVSAAKFATEWEDEHVMTAQSVSRYTQVEGLRRIGGITGHVCAPARVEEMEVQTR